MDFLLNTDDPDAARRWLSRGALAGGVVEIPSRGSPSDASLASRWKAIYDPHPMILDLPEVWDVDRDAVEGILRLPLFAGSGEDCLAAVHTLATAGRRIGIRNCTSVGQVMLGWKAGAEHVALAWGGILDAGGDPLRVVAGCIQWGGLRNSGQLLVVEDIRQVGDVYEVLRSGADALVVSADLLWRLAASANRGHAC